jgi:hypothetical protein
MRTLFRDWATVARELKRVPSSVEYVRLGNYSKGTLSARFGGWDKVAPGLKRYAEVNGKAKEWKDVMEFISEQETEMALRCSKSGASKGDATVKEAKAIPGRPVYGPPMRPCALAHCPTLPIWFSGARFGFYGDESTSGVS